MRVGYLRLSKDFCYIGKCNFKHQWPSLAFTSARYMVMKIVGIPTALADSQLLADHHWHFHAYPMILSVYATEYCLNFENKQTHAHTHTCTHTPTHIHRKPPTHLPTYPHTHTYTPTHTHIHTHTHTHKHTNTQTHACTRTRTHAHTHTRTRARAHKQTRANAGRRQFTVYYFY